MSPERKSRILVTLIILLALTLRFYGINWDQGMHLHPDERMLIMVAERINFFSNLNPDFFNYGSLPIYLLKGSGQLFELITRTDYTSYDGLLGVGRLLSVLADTITVFLVYKIGMRLFQKTSVALFAAFAYAIFFFPIQNAHFFVVDVFLTLWITVTIYLLIGYIEHPSLKTIFFIALSSAAAVTTKVTGVLLVPIVLVAFLLRTANSKQRIANSYLLFTLCYLLFTFIFMPFAFLLPYRYLIETCGSIGFFIAGNCTISLQQMPVIKDILLQTKMNSDPFIFPYTLQYVGTTPYWYYLKNIFWWGVGPVFSVVGLMGLVSLMGRMSQLKIKPAVTVVTIFYILYFLLIGKSAVKFMRYMLPLYPAFALLTGYALDKITNYELRLPAGALAKAGITSSPLQKLPRIISALVLILAIVWTLMFTSIYSREHTRITASKWIYENIPAGSTLAVEHWDDRLPLLLPVQQIVNPTSSRQGGITLGAGNQLPTYQFEELALYEQDTEDKWVRINQQLAQTDFIIIASNRLYIPLTKLTQCEKLPPGRCYPITAQYYNELFNGTRGFTKVAEFSSYPELRITPAHRSLSEGGNFELRIPDDVADESFTVYDHPKIMIFKRQ